MNALTYDFYPLANGDADREIIPRWQRISTLELAIKAEAKRLLAHPAVIQILEEIWNGSVMFQSSMHKLHRARFSNEEEVVDAGYGRRGPGIRYRYEDASILKLSRLRVPRYRHFLNLASFCVLLALYIMVLFNKPEKFSGLELLFWLWSLGFILDEIVGFSDAGFTLYIMSLWNWFDLMILILLVSYAGVSALSFLIASHRKLLSNTAHDILATIAIFLFPRLFSILDNYEIFSQMVISVRRMTLDLMVACIIIVFFSSGFWVAFTMAFARDVFSPDKVAYDLLKILNGFTPAVWDNLKYYSFIGKVMLLFYLFVTHFLIMTILIAVLSNSFSAVTSNAHEEHQYLFAVNTITMIKSESSSLFSYTAPLNLIEWLIRPLYYVMPLRNFLLLNRAIIKVTHFPVLVTIFIYEKLHLRLLYLREKHIEKAALRKQVLKQNLLYPENVSNQESRRQSQQNSSIAQSSRTSRGQSVREEYSGQLTPKKTRRTNNNSNNNNNNNNIKINNSRMSDQRRKINSSKHKISNDELLDEVFKRPYKGTIKVKPNIMLENESSKPVNFSSGGLSGKGDMSGSFAKAFASEINSDPEETTRRYDDGYLSEQTDFLMDDDIDGSVIHPSFGSILRSNSGRSRRLSHRLYSQESAIPLHPRTTGFNRTLVPPKSKNGTFRLVNISNRARRRSFSTTSSLVRGAAILAISPTRSTGSYLDRHIMIQMSAKRRQGVNRREITEYRNSPGMRKRSSEYDIEEAVEEEEEPVDNEDFEVTDDERNHSVNFGPSDQMSEEIQDMSRMIMGRIDSLEEGFKNIESLLLQLSYNPPTLTKNSIQQSDKEVASLGITSSSPEESTVKDWKKFNGS